MRKKSVLNSRSVRRALMIALTGFEALAVRTAQASGEASRITCSSPDPKLFLEVRYGKGDYPTFPAFADIEAPSYRLSGKDIPGTGSVKYWGPGLFYFKFPLSSDLTGLLDLPLPYGQFRGELHLTETASGTVTVLEIFCEMVEAARDFPGCRNGEQVCISWSRDPYCAKVCNQG